MSLSGKRRIQSVVLVLFTAVVAYASASGPEPGYTDAPGDLGNCTSCHDKHPANDGNGSVRIDGLPAVYNPGQVYNFTVTTSRGGRIRFGFQLTALDGSSSRAGTLASLDGNTQVLPQTGLGGRQYIEHTQQGSLAPVVGSRTWQIRWTAPATDVGTVRFFAAGNATNNSGVQDDDDFIYTNSAVVDSPTSAVTVTLQSQPGGLVLGTGSHFTINWALTGLSNVDNIELRYSTDDGMTFPITNLIFSTTNAQTTSYDWTVPNTPTNQARLRISVGKKSGDAAPPALSGKFTIDANGGSAPAPLILEVTASGKKLFVMGQNFMMGAFIEVNGAEKGTNNEEDFSHVLRSKKGAKKIHEGDTVTIVVINPDGTRSAPFSFTRPPE